jgi:phosphoglycolate phosphatase-like HAD superfamily hydrolase
MMTIVWDVDDVLNDLMLTWFTETWKPSHPSCDLSYSEITENPPDRVLGIPRSEYLSSLDAFRLSDRARNMPPNPAVLEWLHRNGAGYRHMAVTARPLASTPPVAEWLFRHFGSFMRTFGVVPARLSASVPAYDRDKGEYLRWLGKADILVDDSEENLRAAEKLGICGVLYPQPWNHSSQTAREALESLAQRAEANSD